MAYSYEIERPWIFTEEGQVALIKTRDHVLALLKKAGCARMDHCYAASVADSWKYLALVDRLVEMGDIREINYGECAGQHRIFVGVTEGN